MDLDLEYIEIDDVIPYNKFEKEQLRKQLIKDIEDFLNNGGKIDFVDSEIAIPHYKAVGNFKEGLRGSSQYSSNKD